MNVGLTGSVCDGSLQACPGPGGEGGHVAITKGGPGEPSALGSLTSKTGRGKKSCTVSFSASPEGIVFSSRNVTRSPGRTSCGALSEFEQAGPLGPQTGLKMPKVLARVTS